MSALRPRALPGTALTVSGALLLLALLLALPARAELQRIGIVVGAERLTVEVADEEHERQRGLMYRRSLEPGHGMLFVYPDTWRRAFWMKNTPLPLDIAFIDEHGTLTEILPLEPLSESVVQSRYPARYALEVPRGWFAAHGIGPGARMTFDAGGR
jgi:hypothetical protein